jgi:ribosomal protein L24
MIKYEFHPLSNSLPLLHEPDASEFAESIRQNGQLVPIGIFEGKILDGRNRYIACKKLGIEGKFEKVSPKDAKAYVTAINVQRRHLTRWERQHHLMCLIAEQDALQMTNAEVAKAADVSEKTVERKKSEKRKNTPKTPVLRGIPPEKVKSNGVVDSYGFPVPAEAMAYWNRKSEVQEILSHISAARTRLEKIVDGDPLYRRAMRPQAVHGKLDECYNTIKGALPTRVCPMCDGVKIDNCKQCVGTGVISDYVWKTVDPKLKKKRENACA